VADESEELPTAEVNDTVLLRTAQSLEYTALAVYEAAGATGALTSGQTTLAERFVADHTGHAAAVGSLIDELGGDQFTCPNPFIMERAVTPILGALDGTDDLNRDLLNIAHAFEALAGASYQALVTALTDPKLRSEAMRIGADENRHAAALAAAVNPDGLISPVLSGGQAEKDSNGFPLLYAIPATFGQLTAVELVVGAEDTEGARYSTLLQTPAENAFVYEYESC
jgi:hypothetical protein